MRLCERVMIALPGEIMKQKIFANASGKGNILLFVCGGSRIISVKREEW